MSSTYTPSLTLTQIGNGEQSGTWGTTTNTNWQLIEDAVAGVASVSISGTSGATLSVANGTTDQSRKAVIVVTGATSGTNAIVAPLQPKVYLVSNQTTGGFNITIGASTGSVVTIPSGVTTLVYCDGTNFSSGITGFTGGNLSITGSITATGTITGATFATSGGVPQLAGGAANQIHYQTGANATSYVTAPPSTGSSTFLAYTPGTGFNWQTSSTTASNINGGSANTLVYQTGANTTSFITAPASPNQVLTWNGSQIIWQSGGAVSSVSASSPLASSGGTSPTISLSGVVPIANGGTGATSFAAAGLATTTALSSYLPLAGGTMTGAVTNTVGNFIVSYSGLTASLTNNGIQCSSTAGIGVAYYSSTMNILNSGGSFSLDTGGNIYISGSTAQKASGTTWTNPSDVRLKKNIVDYTDGLASLLQVNPKTWEYNGLGGTTDGEKGLGVIADEIESVLPETVTTYSAKLNKTDEETIDIKQFDATEITWLLVNAVKELSAKVDAQEAEITALKAKVGI